MSKWRSKYRYKSAITVQWGSWKYRFLPCS